MTKGEGRSSICDLGEDLLILMQTLEIPKDGKKELNLLPLKGLHQVRMVLLSADLLGQTDLWSELSKISKPVLLIAGAKDEVTTVSEAEKMKELISHSHLEVLKASHLSNIEDSCFTEVLLAHLRRSRG